MKDLLRNFSRCQSLQLTIRKGVDDVCFTYCPAYVSESNRLCTLCIADKNDGLSPFKVTDVED